MHDEWRNSGPEGRDLNPVAARPVVAPAAPVDVLKLEWVSRPAAVVALLAAVLLLVALPFWPLLFAALSLTPEGAQPGEDLEFDVSLLLVDKVIWLGWSAVVIVVLASVLRLPRAAIGFKPLRSASDYGWELLYAIGGLIACYVTLALTLLLIIPIFLFWEGGATEDVRQRVDLFESLPLGDWSFVFVFLPLVAIHEELVFRSVLLPLARRAVGSWTGAIIIGAVLFGALHVSQGLLGMLTTTLLGVTFGVVFVYTRSVWNVMLSHFLFNFLQFQFINRVLPELAEQFG